MLHKISELCNKVDVVKKQSDKLYKLKYENKKTIERDAEIDFLISDIQYLCKNIANDKSKYEKD